jgi:hypothetical protein
MVGVQGDDLAWAQRFATGKLPLNREYHTVEMTFFDDTALTNVLMIDPRWEPLGKGQGKTELVVAAVLPQNQGESAPREGIAAG